MLDQNLESNEVLGSTVLKAANYREVKNTRDGVAAGIFCNVEEDGRKWTMVCENLDPNQSVWVIRSEPSHGTFEHVDQVELGPSEKKTITFKVDNDENFFYALVRDTDGQYRTMAGKTSDNSQPNYTNKSEINPGDFSFQWRVMGRSTFVDHDTISVKLTW